MSASAIEHLPPSLLNTIPVATPPPGVQPNFSDPPTLVPAVLGVGASFLALALFCFSLRVWTKLFIDRKCSWDDLTCTLGFLFALVMYAAIVLGCDKGSLGRHLWDVHLSQHFGSAGLASDYLTMVFGIPALGLIKSSLFIQYYSLFWPLRWARVSVWIGATISTLFYTAVSIMSFVVLSPWPGESMLDHMLSWHYDIFFQLSVAVGTVGMLLDLYLLILPIKVVLNLNMRTGKKIGLIVLFLTGQLAVVASSAGIYYRVKLREDGTDAMWKVAHIRIWSQIETFAGVSCSSMPAVYKFLGHQNLSIESLKSSLQYNFSRLSNANSTRGRLPDYDQSNTARTQSDVQSSYDVGHRLGNVKSKGEQAVLPPCVLREISIIQCEEQGDSKSYEPSPNCLW